MRPQRPLADTPSAAAACFSVRSEVGPALRGRRLREPLPNAVLSAVSTRWRACAMPVPGRAVDRYAKAAVGLRSAIEGDGGGFRCVAMKRVHAQILLVAAPSMTASRPCPDPPL